MSHIIVTLEIALYGDSSRYAYPIDAILRPNPSDPCHRRPEYVASVLSLDPSLILYLHSDTQGDTATSNTQPHLQAQQALLAAFVSFLRPILHTHVLAVGRMIMPQSSHGDASLVLQLLEIFQFPTIRVTPIVRISGSLIRYSTLILFIDQLVPDNNTGAETGGMAEGRKLLFALEEFITVTVRSHFVEQRDISITEQKKDGMCPCDISNACIQ